ncbi:hypothetical protein GWI33_007089 [Rhynchophorus ferrugineus]|uniref:Uncharacterized protein n=1 Tax=Rhynchophorus ferrugineus TaxID=354439 RepID=A0A834ITJ6_RHYFE|nr:hypothetical protein GWI33_007089 [Rhynchophorus ferrugineus]
MIVVLRLITLQSRARTRIETAEPHFFLHVADASTAISLLSYRRRTRHAAGLPAVLVINFEQKPFNKNEIAPFPNRRQALILITGITRFSFNVTRLVTCSRRIIKRLSPAIRREKSGPNVQQTPNSCSVRDNPPQG